MRINVFINCLPETGKCATIMVNRNVSNCYSIMSAIKVVGDTEQLFFD